jgi:hypothetical protein
MMHDLKFSVVVMKNSISWDKALCSEFVVADISEFCF